MGIVDVHPLSSKDKFKGITLTTSLNLTKKNKIADLHTFHYLFLYQVYCHMTNVGEGWTLIARFSSSDEKSWMNDTGSLWYDQKVAEGTTTSPLPNTDMISPAFWLASGKEFKITRSDDPSHTPLLQTTGNCLAGQTFRSKIISYGNFRDGKVWASNRCLGT